MIKKSICTFLLLFSNIVVRADPFIDRIVSVEFGTYAGFGQEAMPGIVLGPPQGAGLTGGSLDVLSLGNGGSITLEFVDNTPINGPGPDLIVFENAFFVGGDPLYTFSEVAFVEVSQDGDSFHRFPCNYDPDGTPINNPANWTGFAGVLPVLSTPDNGIDPTDPGAAGGDAFEFDDVGLDWIRFVRIIDTNEPPDAATDDDGDPIYDAGVTSEGNSGFDLDAVAAVHGNTPGTPTPTPSPTPTLPSTGTPTPTPDDEPSLDLTLGGTHFTAGDPFVLRLIIDMPGNDGQSVNEFIVLDVHGSFFFWPSWGPDLDYLNATVPAGHSDRTVLDFLWPPTDSHDTGIRIWAALLNDSMQLVCDVDFTEFSF